VHQPGDAQDRLQRALEHQVDGEYLEARKLYAEVIETWRTSCPRLTIWEDAIDHGYVARQPSAGAGVRVTVTEHGEKSMGTSISGDFSIALQPPFACTYDTIRGRLASTVSPTIFILSAEILSKSSSALCQYG